MTCWNCLALCKRWISHYYQLQCLTSLTAWQDYCIYIAHPEHRAPNLFFRLCLRLTVHPDRLSFTRSPSKSCLDAACPWGKIMIHCSQVMFLKTLLCFARTLRQFTKHFSPTFVAWWFHRFYPRVTSPECWWRHFDRSCNVLLGVN